MHITIALNAPTAQALETYQSLNMSDQIRNRTSRHFHMHNCDNESITKIVVFDVDIKSEPVCRKVTEMVKYLDEYNSETNIKHLDIIMWDSENNLIKEFISSIYDMDQRIFQHYENYCETPEAKHIITNWRYNLKKRY